MTTASNCEVVAALGHLIAQRIGEPRYDLFFTGKTKFTWNDGQLIVGVPNRFVQEWLENTFAEDIRQAAQQFLGRAVHVIFTIDPQLFQMARQKEAAVAPSFQPRNKNDPPASSLRREGEDLATDFQKTVRTARHWRQLRDFVVGPGNRMAHASALSVVEHPGQGVNPLVLHGGVGTGKTHLLEGIYAGLRQRYPAFQVRFVRAEEFTQRFIQAMRSGKIGSFRRFYRDCDALLLDDLDFLSRKKATQEEFLYTFDAMIAQNRQIVVTCACHPKLADTFSPELTDRLLGGPVCSLLPPELETRKGILRLKAVLAGTHLPEDVVDYLASHLDGHVRELEGALHSIRHFSRVANRPIDLALAREAVADLLRHSVRVLEVEDVHRAVCRALGLDEKSLRSKDRSWAVSHPRMIAMFLARKHTRATYAEIGKYFGGRIHSTVVAAEKKVRTWLDEDSECTFARHRWRVREIVERIEREMLR
ncbi:MAG: chromosomal replication initiator protein DnaA [Gemmatales bacterium]|nr:MAG: chromosomal replication initiator protein DnaA [Gemmatales bacterium]